MKIIHEKSKCIGCGVCASMCDKYFEMGEDGKSHLKSSKEVGEGKYELEVDDAGCAKEAAESCPVQCIHIVNE